MVVSNTLVSSPGENDILASDTGISNVIGSDPIGNVGETVDPMESEAKVVDQEANRLFIGQDTFGGTLPKQTYEKLLACKFSVQGYLNVMKVFIKCMARLKKFDLSELELEAESWHILVRTSQRYYYPPKKTGHLREGDVWNSLTCVQTRSDAEELQY